VGLERYPKTLEATQSSRSPALVFSGAPDTSQTAPVQSSSRENSLLRRENTERVPPGHLSIAGLSPDITLIQIEGDDEYIEPLYGFAPSTYSVDAKLRQVVLTIKRNHPYGEACVFLSTSEEGTAHPGRDFQPVVREPIIFPDRLDSVSYVFQWGLGPEGLQGGWGGGENLIQTINFVLTGADEKPVKPIEDAPATAVLIIEGSGQPEPLPEPQTEEEYSPPPYFFFFFFLIKRKFLTNFSFFLSFFFSKRNTKILLDKFTNLFPDINPVTISGIVAREKKQSGSMKEIEDKIMKKVLWYKDLPIEDHILPKEVSYDQSSFKYNPTSSEKKEGKHESDFQLVSKETQSAKGASSLPNAEWNAEELYQEKRSLPPPPKPKKNISNLGVLAPPPPPSIVGSSSFQNDGFVMKGEVDAFILSACLDYLRSRFTLYHSFQNSPPEQKEN